MWLLRLILPVRFIPLVGTIYGSFQKANNVIELFDLFECSQSEYTVVFGSAATA